MTSDENFRATRRADVMFTFLLPRSGKQFSAPPPKLPDLLTKGETFGASPFAFALKLPSIDGPLHWGRGPGRMLQFQPSRFPERGK